MISKVGERSFTLIELLVVISIIGILSSIVLAFVQTARNQADDAVKQLAVVQFVNALELFYSSNNYYPTPTHSIGTYLGSTIYTGCLKMDTKDQCTYRNNTFADPTLDTALSPYIKSPINTTRPVLVNYPDSVYGAGGAKADVGGLEYDCVPVTTTGSIPVPNKCQSYIINWVMNASTGKCALGGRQMFSAPGRIGYQRTNVACAKGNNDAFTDFYWNSPTWPAPYF